MAVIKYIRLPFQFDATLLKQEVTAISEKHWLLHYQTLQYDGGWSAIPLRSINGNTDNIFISPHPQAVYADTAFLTNSIYLKEVLSFFKCPLLAVRLLKLEAGAIIKEHKDADLAFEKGEIRIHIPVQTNDEVEFMLGKERMLVKEGDCWYMNFNLSHSIHNKSKYDRIHLVIDATANDWVKNLFGQPGLLRREIEEEGYDIETKKQIIARLREMNTETATDMANEMEASLH